MKVSEKKAIYKKLQNAGGYKPTASDYTTKLVKKSNNTYMAGPFKLNYIERKTDDVNFSYIENMYLKDQDGDVIDDIEIIIETAWRWHEGHPEGY